MKRLLLLICLSHYIHGKAQDKITIPSFKDAYCKTVARLEAGETDIDFSEFRFSFLESRQYTIRKNEQSALFDSLKKALFAAADKDNHKAVIAIAQKMLSIDYTYLYAQKFLSQAYKGLDDRENTIKYKDIEMGLLMSIIRKNDGKTCEASWEAAQVYEEYFVLDMINASVLKQSLKQSQNSICDEMEVKEDGEVRHYYFDVAKMLAVTEKKLNGNK